MNCRNVQARLSAYLDGELSGHEMLQMRRHLDSCCECGCESEELGRLKSCLSSIRPCEPPAGFEERLVSHVFHAPSRLSQSWPSRFGLTSVAVLAAALAFVAFAQLRAPAAGTAERHDVAYSSRMSRDQAYFSATDPLSPAPMAMVNYEDR